KRVLNCPYCHHDDETARRLAKTYTRYVIYTEYAIVTRKLRDCLKLFPSAKARLAGRGDCCPVEVIVIATSVCTYCTNIPKPLYLHSNEAIGRADPDTDTRRL
ncbi:unnamed protein product, partial [Laminaria digitata]